MFHDDETVVTVGAGGRVELTLPDAEPGTRVRVAVRESDDALRRENIYADDAP